MDNTTLDVRGLSCPQPAMLTRQHLAKHNSGIAEILVDSGTARDNVIRTAERAGWRLHSQDQSDDGIRLVFRK